MAREHPDLRDQIAEINSLHPGQLMLSIEEGMQLTRIKSKNTYRKYFGPYMPRGSNDVSRLYIAKYLCGLI